MLPILVSVLVAVDVGGTFTDLVAVDEEGGEIYKVKVRSTPRNPEEGFLEAMKKLLSENRLVSSKVKLIIHVNTIGTNLFRGQLGLRIPTAALITTRGFRDIIEIGRQNRPELYNIFYRKPDPLVKKELRFEVEERVDSCGRILKRVDAAELSKVASLLKKYGVETVAVCFLNSYINSSNEEAAKQYLRGYINIPIFTSHEVNPEHREYERMSTTVVNAILAPVVARYLEAVREGLSTLRINAPLQIMSSSGGIVDVEEVIRRPICSIESGPAAGVIGSAELAKILGFRNVISLDMGGTTAKTGAIVDGSPMYVPEIEVGGRVHMGRIVKGSGYPVRYPSIDLAEVSAGGGTIIDVDAAGALRVGPMSAGSDPGPACYGLGGREPTITDANLLLGRLEHLLEGEFKLSKELAYTALQPIAERAGMSVQEAAWSALTIVNLQMARAVHIVSLERGYDPSDFVLIAFGGAGPMHAVELAMQIGISTIVIPPSPGLFSSIGLLMTDMNYTYVKGLLKVLEIGDEEMLEKIFQGMEREALSQLRQRGIDVKDVRIRRSIDVRYYGQGYELEVNVNSPISIVDVVRAFEEKHEKVYGYRHAGERVEMTALRIAVTIPRRKMSIHHLSIATSRERKVKHRRVFFEDGWHDTPVYQREALKIGEKINGPAVIEEYDSTTVLPPAWQLRVHETGCMVIERT
jgi:N-methylhydantoinase A